jgi:hypothetical protein
MDWEFTEDAAFMALCDAFRESGESSAIEFLANGEGAFHFQSSPRMQRVRAWT